MYETFLEISHTLFEDICSKQKCRVNFWRGKKKTTTTKLHLPDFPYRLHDAEPFFRGILWPFPLVWTSPALWGVPREAPNQLCEASHEEQKWTFSPALCVYRHRPIFNSFIPFKSNAGDKGTPPPPTRTSCLMHCEQISCLCWYQDVILHWSKPHWPLPHLQRQEFNLNVILNSTIRLCHCYYPHFFFLIPRLLSIFMFTDFNFNCTLDYPKLLGNVWR